MHASACFQKHLYALILIGSIVEEKFRNFKSNVMLLK